MENITMLQLHDFTIVAMAILAFIVLLGNVIKVFKDFRKPHETFEEWQASVDKKLGNDNERIESIEEANKVICRGILALLSHEINGNSIDKLKSSQQEITDYLIDR